MAEFTVEEMECIMGRLGYRDAFDSCNDPDGSEIYGHWAAQEAYLDYRAAVELALDIAFTQYSAAANKASTPEQAKQQAATCRIDPLFVNMMSSPNFKQKELELILSANANMIEYGLNYYGNDNFGGIFSRRLPDRIPISLFDTLHLFYGKADVFIHTHQGPGVLPGLSAEGGDLSTANNLNIGIMAIDISNPDNPVYYCYNPNNGKPVI